MNIELRKLIEYLESARKTAESLVEQGKRQEGSDIIQLVMLIESRKIKFVD